MKHDIATLTASGDYRALIHQRHRVVWPLLCLTVLSYLGFILLIAFAPASLGVPVVEGGVISVGILLGLALIVLNFIITLLYVRAANRHIEPLIARIHGDAK
jgi:uncharacterized membrane protein (DUF485 family)